MDRAGEQNPTTPLTATRSGGEEPDHDAATRDNLARDQFLRRAKSRFKLCVDGEQLQRKRSLEEVDFNSGNHWDGELRKQREAADRVVLEVNRTPQFLNQVANEQRMTRPQIIVRPTGEGSDPDTADIKQGIIRATERRYQAEEIRDDAFYGVLEKGWAYYRVVEDYENEHSFRRIFKPVRINDDFSVYCDPNAPNRIDAEFYFITDDMPVEEFRALHPESELAGLTEFTPLGDEEKYWIGDGTIRTCEYYYKVREPMLLYNVGDDRGKFKDEMTDDDWLTVLRDEKGEPIYRQSSRERIFWAKISAKDVLDGNDSKTAGRRILGSHIPIIPVLGRKVRVEGRYVFCGMVRDAIQPCLASDYWLSAITEMVALGPKAPWIAAYKSIARYKEMWDTANIDNWSALYYDHVDESGNPLPAPSRQFGEVPIQGMTYILNYADEDLKRVMGIFNASLGAPGPETSGVAIGRRQQESDVANYNYIDNLKRSIAYEARVYLSLMRDVLTAPQVMDMVRPDGSTEKVLINKEFKDPATGENKTYDMQAGDYDSEVEVGPSYNTRREEAAAGMTEYLKIDPQAAPLVGDLIVDNQDYPNKEQFKERLKIRASQLAPGIVQNDDTDQAKVPPKFMAQYQQQSQLLEKLQQQLDAVTKVVTEKTMEFQHEKEMKAMELASQERQTSLKVEGDMVKAEAAAKSQASLQMLQSAIDQVNNDMAEFRKPGPVEYEFDPASQQLVAPGSALQQQQTPAPQPQQPMPHPQMTAQPGTAA